jgi:hypothetical protein
MDESIAAAKNASVTPAVPLADYHRSIDVLDRAIVNLSAKRATDEYRLLMLVHEFDERGGWLRWGLSSCPE